MQYKLVKLLSFLSFLFISNVILPQYSVKDSTLVRTTYLREFDKNIIYDYLASEDSNKINAALLSIAQSEDTTFVDSVITLDFNKFGGMISFTLGELGTSPKATKFLLDKLLSDSIHNSKESFNAIGKIGDSLTLSTLFENINTDRIKNTEGFPYALVNFYNQGIQNKNTIPYLTSQIGRSDISSDELFKNLYALYRIGPTTESFPNLFKILEQSYADSVVQYTLNNLRKLKTFPHIVEVMKKLVSSDSWNVRTEAATVLCFYPFQSFAELKIYLSMIDDTNPNVSRSAALSLKNIWKKEVFKDSLRTYLENKLKDNKLTKNTKGELFVSYCSLYPDKIEDKVDDYEDYIDRKFIYRVLTINNTDTDFNYDYLTDYISESDEVELLDLLPAFLSLQTRYLNEEEYAAVILKVLSGDKPSSVSIVADGFHRPFIHHYQDMLQEIVIDQVFKYRNNPQFVEALFSLGNLAAKINPNFHFTVLDMLGQSKLYSVRKFAAKQLGEPLPIKNDTLRFDICWQNAFKYKTAKIETEKGTITILLKPKYAPISVGNFVSLAENHFYDGVKFHRVVPDFVIQAGDTTGTGWGGPGYEIVSEFSPRPFIQGAVGMASAGKDTEGSQWFIMHSHFPYLNERYTNWAEVIKGMDVVDIIDEGDKIISIELLK